MNQASDKSFERRARTLYHEAGRRLDPTTAGRLRAARRTALAAPQAHGHPRLGTLLPIGALAAVALAALMIWQPPRHDVAASMPDATPAAGMPTVDNELPPDPDGNIDPKLYQNLDFYSWLAANDAQPPPANTH